jgi:hypothetical protein
VNLRAAIRDGSITDPNVVRQIVTDMDEDLARWEMSLPQSWSYTETDADDPRVICFNNKRHKYPDLWVADIWNNWRVLRILVCRYALRQDGLSTAACEADKVNTHLMIQRYSRDVCKSVPCFFGSPRECNFDIFQSAFLTVLTGFIALIRPLYAVAIQAHNDESTRKFAIAILRLIDDGMGVRQARLLADTATERLTSRPSYNTPCQKELDMSHVLWSDSRH